jgi:hypothetical protein
MAEPNRPPLPVAGVSPDGDAPDGETNHTPDGAGTPPQDNSPPTYAVDDTPPLEAQQSPRLSRNDSFSASSSYHDDWDAFPPLDRMTVLDLLDNFALPQQLEKLQKGISAQTQKVRKSREAFKTKGQAARERMVEEWRRRVPSADEQLDRYRTRMRTSVEKLGHQWNDTKVITLREKVSFICGVMNIFISGYLLGGYPEYFHVWYTAQLLYFMPIRFFTYRRRGYHYFLADLCYFTNFLLVFSLWVFPASKRLFIASYCLAMGNNAVAIIMWRNSLVFHSFDKVTSLFIHIMPCATLHSIVHLIPEALQKEKFPALWEIKTSPPGSPTAYANIISMVAWSTIPYTFWQLSYYFMITVRRRDKIAAGRPTSFTWLRRSYSKTWLGRLVLSLPEALQEAAFMLIQYAYAALTMLPCSLWFYSRWASGIFMTVVFTWSIYNGATFYIDVFGKRFQKELENMKAEVQKWQHSPELAELALQSPLMTPLPDGKLAPVDAAGEALRMGNLAAKKGSVQAVDPATGRSLNVNNIPLLDDKDDKSLRRTVVDPEANVIATAVDTDKGANDTARERKPTALNGEATS